MSNKPNPVASTAAMLAQRWFTGSLALPNNPADANAQHAADLASRLHRIAPAFQRHAEALCNGEQRQGQRDYYHRQAPDVCKSGLATLDAMIEKEGQRLERKLAHLNTLLEPFALKACDGGDPRGWTLWLESTDEAQPIAGNGWDREKWGIE